ncbi:substrate-binding domain-containing protein [Leucobacter weissii]|uniref:Substrate-binding domain-containing protein n=1 Tax=Leucobacter weissii TaxID=1983706 RepID=A0A939SCC3_9MICO|nr:substrate-binding domain-containing protein [Leucobacter weissii]MBO1902218.1 substrate-binding domain-containing protein [Leucobacter weissii]
MTTTIIGSPGASRAAGSPRRALARSVTALLAAVLPAAMLSGCIGAPGADESKTLHVLAGSEVKDMQPILDEMEAETGVHLEFEFTGTLDGTEKLLAEGEDAPWQATWFPSNSYLSLFPETELLVTAETSIMRSPVVLGVKPEVADRLGWTEADQPAWQEVVDAIEAGELSYGMTSPVSSNSGFTTLVQAATALSGTGTVLEADDIEAVTEPLTAFAAGQKLTSGSSGWLAEKFAEDPDAADAIFNYESVLQTMSVAGEPLRVVIPSDGVVTSNYPLTLLSSAGEEKAELYRQAVAYLSGDEVQQRIADLTKRRTSATASGGASGQVFELPFPARLETVQQLLEVWLSEARKPANMVFAIDTSGSMGEGSRMEDLREALHVLVGDQSGGSTGFLRLKPRERITLLEFSHEEKSQLTVDVPEDEAGFDAAMQRLNDRIDAYWPDGGTDIYGTTIDALELAAREAGDDRITSVVLFTDGQHTEELNAADFAAWYERAVARVPVIGEIPVFAVVFAEADQEEMERLAETTGGRAFQAGQDSLSSVFREIRGYL